ncbi:hypothetical protein L915_17924, partial [Phytophthora nicotianae]
EIGSPTLGFVRAWRNPNDIIPKVSKHMSQSLGGIVLY